MTLERRRSLAAAAAGFLSFVNLYTPHAILPLLAEAFHVPLTRTGLAVTASLFAVAIVAPFAGVISDRVGRKRLIVGACVLVVAPTLLVAQSGSLTELVGWRFLQGLLLPFVFTVTVGYINDECDGPEAIRAAGVYSAGAIVGGFSGRFIAGFAAEWGGWPSAFLATAAITAAGAAVLAFALPRERRFAPMRGGIPTVLRNWAEHVRNPRLIGTCAVGFTMLFSLVAMFTFINIRLALPPFGLSPAALGSIFAVYLAGAVTTPLVTRLAVRAGRVRTALIGAALAVTGELVTLSGSLPLIIAGLAIASSGLFAAQSLGLGFIGTAVRRAKSSAVGLYVGSYYVGGALGGVAPEWAWHHAGWPGCVALLCGIAGLLAVAAAFSFRVPAPPQIATLRG